MKKQTKLSYTGEKEVNIIALRLGFNDEAYELCFCISVEAIQTKNVPEQYTSLLSPSLFHITFTSNMFRLFFILAALTSATACPQHEINQHTKTLNKRAEGTEDWTYKTSYNWGMINKSASHLPYPPLFHAPLTKLSRLHTLPNRHKQNHVPSFTTGCSTPASGIYYNWGYQPAFTTNSTVITSAPSMTYNNGTLYTKGWHIHSPADHSVQNDRSKAQLHLVHADSSEIERGLW